jgi:FkbM family methyltransferase
MNGYTPGYYEICSETIASTFDKDLNHSQFIEGHKNTRTAGGWTTPSKGAIDQLIYQCMLEGKHLQTVQSFFIEAGANNGIRQSNTFVLEVCYGWGGILIEPTSENFRQCRKYRQNSLSINACLGASNETIMGQFHDDIVHKREEGDGGLGAGCTEEHLERYPQFAKESEMITLDKLSKIIDIPERYGLLSIDVEGFEKEVIDGASFSKYRPSVICLETQDSSLEKRILSQGYSVWSKPNENDIIFKDTL